MRDNFTEHVKNIKDDLANHTKQQIEHFFLSIKNDVGKYKNFLRIIISYIWRTPCEIENFLKFLSINKFSIETQIAAQAKNMETLIFSNVRNIIYKHSALTEQSENNISTSVSS